MPVLHMTDQGLIFIPASHIIPQAQTKRMKHLNKMRGKGEAIFIRQNISLKTRCLGTLSKLKQVVQLGGGEGDMIREQRADCEGPGLSN